MKFLKIFIFLNGLMMTCPLAAQNTEECLQNLSIFAEYAKIKNYDEAYEPWMSVRKECPSLNVAIFSYGERILKDRIKKDVAPIAEEQEFDVNKFARSVFGDLAECFVVVGYSNNKMKVMTTSFL